MPVLGPTRLESTAIVSPMTTALAGSGGTVVDRWPLVGRHRELDLAVAALTGPTGRGVAFTGGPGVGKSRLADDVLAVVEASGRRVVRALGTVSARDVPMGALAHLLPPSALSEGPVDPVRLLALARQAIGDDDDAAVVLSVDDAHLLDAASVTLLGQLVGSGAAALLVTVRSDEEVPDGVRALWRSGRLERIELEPLGERSMDTLLHLGLGGPLEGRAQTALRTASAGSPLVARELARAALATGALVSREGVWCLDGPLPPTEHAADLWRTRLDTLDPAARSVLEVLALVGPTRLDVIADVAGMTVLEHLEDEGLVELHTGDAPADDRLALTHPLLGDAVRQSLPKLRARSLLAAHADRVERLAGNHLDDSLHIAAWRLEAGVAGDPDTLESAAALARYAPDLDLTVRVAREAVRLRPTARAAVLLGEALYQQCRWHDAEEVLADATARCTGPVELGPVLAVRSINLLFGLDRPDEAEALIEGALAAAPSGGTDAERWARRELQGRLALVQLYRGRPCDALETLGPEPPGPTSDPATGAGAAADGEARERVVWAMAGAPALALTGSTGRAVALAREAFELHGRIGGEIAYTGPEIHVLSLCLALTEHGALDDATTLAQAGYAAAIGAGSTIGQTWFTLHLARLDHLRGRPAGAERWLRETLALCPPGSWQGPRAVALEGIAGMRALLGDADGARRAEDDFRAEGGTFGFLGPELCIGPAWTAAVEGRLPDARALLAEGVEDARRTGHRTIEARLLHESARLGGAAAAADNLDELAGATESDVVAAMAAQVRAEVDGDPDALEAAAERLEAMGYLLFAAEALASAADLARAGGDQRRATALNARSAELGDRCEGARTPRLTTTSSVVPLTPREREIAVLAAGGMQSKHIAERLHLSVRTVNNHLQNCYTKLGVGSRAELADALGTEP